jgi:hypothetical protein
VFVGVIGILILIASREVQRLDRGVCL